ncbi:hypothetical protein NDU88_005119 [Pleurodeles waltl]|uniref:Uncharacterized protein n=1 Tax=Pleurodeles waltl TaxID=8319 RepID=A0AAV7PEK6_PLEWA|nr:hypothetical protein NDU88_005119 [Pleurodeles waltl]
MKRSGREEVGSPVERVTPRSRELHPGRLRPGETRLSAAVQPSTRPAIEGNLQHGAQDAYRKRVLTPNCADLAAGCPLAPLLPQPRPDRSTEHEQLPTKRRLMIRD